MDFSFKVKGIVTSKIHVRIQNLLRILNLVVCVNVRCHGPTHVRIDCNMQLS